MEEASKKSLQSVFAAVEDPRIDRTKRHLLLDIILIAILAVICGVVENLFRTAQWQSVS